MGIVMGVFVRFLYSSDLLTRLLRSVCLMVNAKVLLCVLKCRVLFLKKKT